jgi:hypothetical protein
VENTAPNAFDSAKMGALMAGRTGQREREGEKNGNTFEDSMAPVPESLTAADFTALEKKALYLREGVKW